LPVAGVRDHIDVTDENFTARGGVAYLPADSPTWWSAHRYATWPFAGLRINHGHITISSLFGRVVVTRANLISLSRVGRIPLFADGIKFVRSDQDEAVIFWAMEANRVLRALHQHGWNVPGDAKSSG
jgi:hypothetical protein